MCYCMVKIDLNQNFSCINSFKMPFRVERPFEKVFMAKIQQQKFNKSLLYFNNSFNKITLYENKDKHALPICRSKLCSTF